ncbi:MAG TPA: hypothetical protein VM243_08815 [Phycisphaerae bacterium]|nr:hypothetical protein [Phycisphaerae bacterium]
MNRVVKQLGCSLVLVCLLAPMALAGEKETQENPIYKHWAQFKPGTYVVLQDVNEAAGQKTKTTMTHTLKEVTPQKVVVETTGVTEMNGEKFENPPTQQEYPATYTIETEKAPAEHEEQKAPGYETEQGEEEIEVAGTKFKAKWVRTEMKQAGMVMTSKMWNCDEVPGQLLKSITETKGEFATKSVMEVVKIEIKK